MTTKPVYVVQLTPIDTGDGVRQLRGLLKLALRRFKLKCISIKEAKEPVAAGSKKLRSSGG
jgi:hypothetical protein